MNTKNLMMASAAVLAAGGLLFSFFPGEILNRLNIDPSIGMGLILQICGALFLGFAMLNWMAKGNITGGIYSRPVAAGNFMHFFVGGLALFKGFISHTNMEYIIIPAVIYIIFAALFGWVLFTHPANKKLISSTRNTLVFRERSH